MQLFDALRTEELARSYLEDGDTIVALRNYDSFVAVVGDVESPGVFPVSDYGELTLAELISLAGGITNFESGGRVFISSGGKTEEIIISPDDFIALTRKVVPLDPLYMYLTRNRPEFMFSVRFRNPVSLDTMTA